MRRFVPHLILLVVFGFSFVIASGAALVLPLPDGSSDYNAGGFLVRHSWVKFAQVAASPFRGDLSEREESALVARFFRLNEEIAEYERVAGDAATAESKRVHAATREAAAVRERGAIENRVEQILEGRLTAAIKEAGLTRHIGRDVVWPPVNVEFEEPPAVLVRSPRSEIRRLSDRLVDGGLPVEEKVRIEGYVESDGETSALVVQIGAIAMYPAIVPPRADHNDTLQTIAHEWVHHYLYFAPLGRSFYNGDKLITLNETVANLVGVELGERMFERYPLEAAPAFVVGDGELVVAAGVVGGRGVATGMVSDDEASVALRGGRSERRRYVGTVLDDVVGWDDRRGSNGTMSLATLSRSAVGPARFFHDSQRQDSFATLRMTSPTNPPGFADAQGLAQAELDFGREMRGLRLEVDGLLAEGRVADAELVMEERRQVFAANGYYIRRINQAYFAFHGSYADTPASSDPIGPKMQRLREASVSLKVFLETAREFTSEVDLDVALR